MGCNCKDGNCACKGNLLPFDSAVVRAFVTGFDFYPKTGWMPAFGSVRAARRLLAEQTDGVDVVCAYQTASYRYDQAGALDDWATVGAVATTEGDSNPEDLALNVAGKFWLRLGYAIRKAAGAGGIGVANAGVSYSLPTERPELLVGPVLLNVFDNPVGTSYTEVLTTAWMPFYQLVAVMMAYESFNATNLRYQVVLQSVKTDPSLETPTEDVVLGAVVGNTSGVVTANNFPTPQPSRPCCVGSSSRPTTTARGPARVPAASTSLPPRSTSRKEAVMKYISGAVPPASPAFGRQVAKASVVGIRGAQKAVGDPSDVVSTRFARPSFRAVDSGFSFKGFDDSASNHSPDPRIRAWSGLEHIQRAQSNIGEKGKASLGCTGVTQKRGVGPPPQDLVDAAKAQALNSIAGEAQCFGSSELCRQTAKGTNNPACQCIEKRVMVPMKTYEFNFEPWTPFNHTVDCYEILWDVWVSLDCLNAFTGVGACTPVQKGQEHEGWGYE